MHGSRLRGVDNLTPFREFAGHAGTAVVPSTEPGRYVDALTSVFGIHPGARPSHAKGVCVSGDFLPNGSAASITMAAHLQDHSSRVNGRFSVGGGNPKADDKAKSVRGLSLRFVSDAGDTTDLIMISVPVFFVATADEFIPYLEARQPDPATGKPDPARVKAYNDSHPASQAQIDYLNRTSVPASYGSTPYWAVNAFKFTNAAGKTVYGRWRVEPISGRLGLTEQQISSLPNDFLVAELQQRIDHGPVEFDLWIQIAQPGDAVTDPTVEWPAHREQINVGRLRFDAFAANACNTTMFNPVGLPDGIAPSEDSTLLVRRPVYVESLKRRLPAAAPHPIP